jgi:N-acetylglucosaminyl-diphospho-decaprenol L-rhamnosyltransferase
MDIAVVVVTWNVRELALDALRSVFEDVKTSGLQVEVYVVDSASSDGSAEAIAAAFPEVKLTASKENLGFGKANNLAIQQIMNGVDLPKAIYLLNPDTITQVGATRALYNALIASPRLGLVGARLSYGDGSFQHGGFGFPGLRQLWVEFFPTPGRLIEGRFNGRYPRELYDAGKPFSVDFTLGATMMLKREVIEQTKGFDEEFFMYCEETDWAWRIHDAGWDVQCIPAAHVIHLAGQSTSQARPQSVINLWTSRLRLYRKHHPAWKFALARWMIAVGMWLKIRRETNSEVQTAYRTVYQMALKP